MGRTVKLFSIFVFWGAEDFQKRRKLEPNVEETQELDSNRVKIILNAFHCKLFSSIGRVSHLFICDLCRSLRNPVTSFTVRPTFELYSIGILS